MSRPDGPVQQPGPDLDQVLDAVVAFIEAATYADATRCEDRLAFRSFNGRLAAEGAQLRDDARRAEDRAADALYGLLDHERVVRLIPSITGRSRAARRAEAEYDRLVASQVTESGQVADDADGVS